MSSEIILLVIGAVITFSLNRISSKLKSNEEKLDRREAEKDERDELILESLNANGCVIKELYECRFHDKPANGDLEAAYQYQRDVKHKLEDYMRRRASR